MNALAHRSFLAILSAAVVIPTVVAGIVAIATTDKEIAPCNPEWGRSRNGCNCIAPPKKGQWCAFGCLIDSRTCKCGFEKVKHHWLNWDLTEGWYKYERNKQCFREEHAVNYTTSCGVECHSCLVFRPCEGISTDRLQKNLADVDGGEEPSATISEQDPLFSFDHQASAEKEEAATTAAGAMPLESLSSSAIPTRTEMMAKTKPTVATFVFPLLLAAMIMVLW